MKKITKVFLRFWIAITSILGLIFGWAALAHSQKPVAITTQASVQAQSLSTTTTDLAPVPSLSQLVGSSGNTNTQSSITVNNTAPLTNFSTTTRLRTRGS